MGEAKRKTAKGKDEHRGLLIELWRPGGLIGPPQRPRSGPQKGSSGGGGPQKNGLGGVAETSIDPVLVPMG